MGRSSGAQSPFPFPHRYQTAVIESVQMVLANPPNNVAYWANLRIQSGGYDWSWKLNADP